ncbi:hypothetical protein [Sphingomonas sp. M1A8_2b]
MLAPPRPRKCHVANVNDADRDAFVDGRQTTAPRRVDSATVARPLPLVAPVTTIT